MRNERDRAIRVAIGEPGLTVDLWKRNPKASLCREAVDILAAWAHAHRFGGAKPEAFALLDSVVREDSERLCRLALRNDSPEAWLKGLERLAAAASDALPGGEMNACAEAALELFHRLDQAELAAWTLLTLDESAGLDMMRRWIRCARAFSENILEFLTIRAYVQRLSVHYDQDAFDEELRFITAKYYAILEESAAVDFDRELSPVERGAFVRILPSMQREDTAENRVLRFIDAALARSAVRYAADAEGPEQSGEELVAMKGAGWSATLSLREEGAVVFVHDEEGMPQENGVFSIGTLSEAVRDGKAVFPVEAFRAAVAAGGTPALRIGDAVFPGEWKRGDEDDV